MKKGLNDSNLFQEVGKKHHRQIETFQFKKQQLTKTHNPSSTKFNGSSSHSLNGPLNSCDPNKAHDWPITYTEPKFLNSSTYDYLMIY